MAEILRAWDPDLSVLIGCAALLVAYCSAHSSDLSRAGWFLAGMTVMLFALISPLDTLGDEYLFSAHMVQHLFITLVGPPLLLIGTPGWLLQPLLRNRVVFLIARVFTFPALAFFLYNADFWLWHAPPLYNATLENQGIHILEHVTFIVFGILNWWPIFSPSEELPRLSLGGQVLYIFLAGMPTVALGAGLTFFPPLYAPYLAAPRIWGLSAAVDQQLGGLIMWIPGNIFYIVIISILFIRWMQEQDAKQRASEADLDDAEDKVVAG